MKTFAALPLLILFLEKVSLSQSLSSQRQYDRRRQRQCSRGLHAAARTTTSHDSSVSSATASCCSRHSVSIRKPMGLVLEEMDANDPTGGVHVIEILSPGHAVEASTSRCGSEDFLAIGDRIVAVEGVDCRSWTFDRIMERLREAPNPVPMEFERQAGTVTLGFDNGVVVAAKSGEILGNVANQANVASIQYDCRSGSCGVCEQKLVLLPQPLSEGGGDDKKINERQQQQYVRPCIACVPNKPGRRFRVLPSDRAANNGGRLRP